MALLSPLNSIRLIHIEKSLVSLTRLKRLLSENADRVSVEGFSAVLELSLGIMHMLQVPGLGFWPNYLIQGSGLTSKPSCLFQGPDLSPKPRCKFTGTDLGTGFSAQGSFRPALWEFSSKSVHLEKISILDLSSF